MPTILVVDDEPDLELLLRQKYRRSIGEGRLTFVFAQDGIEALERLEQDPGIEMVLSDINMPRMDGLTLIEAVRRLDEKLATVIVSAYGDMANIRMAMNRGAFDFLTKPMDFSDLDTTIEKTIRHVQLLRDLRQRQAAAERAHAALSRYFSPNLAGRLALEGDHTALAGSRREVTAVFTDIGGFTSLVETLEPDILAPLVNEYLSGMTGIVFAHEGTLAKIVGDAMHILFGAPADQPDHAARAVACALALDAHSECFREAWAARGVSLGPTRIGINSGPAVVGNFGSSGYFDYTAYGDSINTAARLEAANKALGTRICASRSVVEQIAGFHGRPIGDLLLRGRSAPLRCYEPRSELAADDGLLDAYRAAFGHLDTRDPKALPAFASMVGTWPQDHLASLHLKRLLNGETGAVVQIGA